MKNTLPILLLLALLSCSDKKLPAGDENAQENTADSADKQTTVTEIPEKKEFVISKYSSDDKNIANIDRPEKCSIKDFSFSEKHLRQTWVEKPDAAFATFIIDSKGMFLVDYEREADMPYEINKDSIVVYFNDFIKRGQIKDLNKDELKIHWNGNDSVSNYYRWKH